MDNEINKVTDHVPNVIVNTPAASEHVGDIERRIRVIKERSRGIICTLPYTPFPQIMLVHLLHYAVMWLNNFPVKTGVSDRYSPCEIILCHKLNFKNHCRAPFGSYCEVHEKNSPTISTKSHGLPAICLGPTGNIQGTYSFLNLSTGLVLKRRRFTELPAPDSVIKRVATLAKMSNVSSNLVFANRHKVPFEHKVPFDWPDTDKSITIDPTPMAVLPSLPAEMPEVILSRHAPDTGAIDDEPAGLPDYFNKIDWSQLANNATKNADLDVTEHIPSPPEVIKIDNDTDYVYVPPVTPFIKQEPIISTPVSIHSFPDQHA